MRQGPTGRRRMSKPDGIMLFRELFGEGRIVDGGLELSQIARSQFGFLGARRVESSPAPHQLEIGEADAAAAAGSAAAERIVFEQAQSLLDGYGRFLCRRNGRQDAARYCGACR